MNVRTLRSRLAAFDDDTELFIAPAITASRLGEGRSMSVPHPLRQAKIADISVIGDVDVADHSVGKRRVVLVFVDPMAPVELEQAGSKKKEGSRSSGSMCWNWQYSEESNFARIELSGSFHAAAFDVMFSELAAQDCIAPGRRVLFDDRSLDLSEANESGVLSTSQAFVRNADAFGQGKVAIVMGSMWDFQLACRFETLVRERVSTALRTTLDEREAMVWLQG